MNNKLNSACKSAINSCIKLFLELFIFDKKIRRVLKGRFCQSFLKPYIQDAEAEKINFSDKNKTYRIWQYWDSGIENAPEIVKACVNSVEKYKGSLERVILDDNSIKNYVTIPDYIYKLKEKGVISKAHFADILRTYLLYEYGGCWIAGNQMPYADAVRELVNVPETYKLVSIIAAGVPDVGGITLAEKIPFEKLIYEEKYQ